MRLAESATDALAGADAAVIAAEWPDFAVLSADDCVRAMRTPNIIDAGAFLGESVGRDARVRYFAVGRPAEQHAALAGGRA